MFMVKISNWICSWVGMGKDLGERWVSINKVFWERNMGQNSYQSVVSVVVSNIFYFQPYLGRWSNLTNIFQKGWNHQAVVCWRFFHQIISHLCVLVLPEGLTCPLKVWGVLSMVICTSSHQHHHHHHPSSIIDHPSSIINHPSSIIKHSSSTINHQPSCPAYWKIEVPHSLLPFLPSKLWTTLTLSPGLRCPCQLGRPVFTWENTMQQAPKNMQFLGRIVPSGRSSCSI